MSRRLLVALTALSLAAVAPAGARSDHPPTAKQRAAAQRHALVRRHAAAERRRAAAKAKALAGAAAPAPADVAPAVTVPPVDVPVSDPAPVISAPLSHSLGVTQREYSLALSRTTVGAGTVTVQVLNRGEDAHDLRIEALDGTLAWSLDELASLDTSVPAGVPLAAGTYRVYCSIGDHAARGMKAQLTVLPG